MTLPALTDHDDPLVVLAFTRGCRICGVAPGHPCRDLLGRRLAGGQLVHQDRARTSR